MSESPASLLSVPERGPDRKRALNVLAQRRYRQRRRERIQNLEGRVRSGEAASMLPRIDLASETSHIFQSTGFENLEISVLDQAPGNHSLSGFANTTNGNRSGACSDSNPISSLGAMTDSLDYDMTAFSHTIEFGAELQSLEISQYTFPDDQIISIPELQVMKAGLNIAELLGFTENMWDVTAVRVFDVSLLTTRYIPPNLVPTEAQRRIQHHPLFDLFPWPSVRTKFIVAFTQPVHTRPPAARDPMALMHLFYDMDDTAEGVKISGSDWHAGDSWEVGQAFFKNWWWALDRSIIENSNTLRAKRGAHKLSFGS